MFTLSPSEAYDEILHCVSVGLTPLLSSSPGVGKSSIVHQLAEDFGLKLIDLRLSQCTPEDLQGFPMRTGDKATFTPFDVFPIEDDEIPDGYNGWMLFLDELTSATKPVQAAAYKLILDRMVGSFRLHEKVAIVGAGNKSTDKAVVHTMSTALQTRLIHYEMTHSKDDFLAYAFKKGFDHRITGFISYMPSRLMDFRPEHNDKTFACPRTWDFLSRLIMGQPVSNKIGARVAGTIGQGVAVEFITFAQEYDRLPRFDDIVTAPKTTPVPKEMSTKYATMSMLVEHVDPTNLEHVIEYISRFDVEIQIIFVKAAAVRYPTIRSTHKEFGAYLSKMVRYLE